MQENIVFSQYRGVHYAYREEVLDEKYTPALGATQSTKDIVNQIFRSTLRRTNGATNFVNAALGAFQLKSLLSPSQKLFLEIDPVLNELIQYNCSLILNCERYLSLSENLQYTEYDSMSSDEESELDPQMEVNHFDVEKLAVGRDLHAAAQRISDVGYKGLNIGACNRGEAVLSYRQDKASLEKLANFIHLATINSKEFKHRLSEHCGLQYDPLLHYSNLPLHPILYAMGLKSSGLQSTDRTLVPNYDEHGIPRHPYLGEYIVSIWKNEKKTHTFYVDEMNALRKGLGLQMIGNKLTSGAEKEILSVGGDPNCLLTNRKIVIKMPRFDKDYRSVIKNKFGISQSAFHKIKEAFLLSQLEILAKHKKMILQHIEDYVTALIAEHHINTISPKTAVALVEGINLHSGKNYILKHRSPHSQRQDTWGASDEPDSSYAKHVIKYTSPFGDSRSFSSIKASKNLILSAMKDGFAKIEDLLKLLRTDL